MSFRLVRRTTTRTIYSVLDRYSIKFDDAGIGIYEKDRLLFTAEGDKVNLRAVIQGILTISYAERVYLNEVAKYANDDGICIPDIVNANAECATMMSDINGLKIAGGAFPNLTFVKKHLDREDTRFYEMGCRTTFPIEYLSFEGSYIPFSVEKYMQMLDRLTKDTLINASDFIHVIGASVQAAIDELSGVIKKLEKLVKYTTLDFNFGVLSR